MAGKPTTPTVLPGRPTLDFFAPVTLHAAGQKIVFYGEVYTNPGENRVFSAYAGDTAPVVTGGYAKYQVIDRPQRIGLTVFQGFDPIQLEIPIRLTRFGSDASWRTDIDAARQIEIDCETLEWMAGRETGAKKATLIGETPRVYVSTTDATGTSIPLIPFHYQPTSPGIDDPLKNYGPPSFVVSDLAWDENALRNDKGYRIRQDARVTLTQFIADEVTGSQSAATRAHNVKGAKGKTHIVRSAPGRDTCVLIARYAGAKDIYKAGEEIKKANPKLHISSARRTVIAHHTPVKVPVVL